jgi:hypothetical protein
MKLGGEKKDRRRVLISCAVKREKMIKISIFFKKIDQNCYSKKEEGRKRS